MPEERWAEGPSEDAEEATSQISTGNIASIILLMMLALLLVHALA